MKHLKNAQKQIHILSKFSLSYNRLGANFDSIVISKLVRNVRRTTISFEYLFRTSLGDA